MKLSNLNLGDLPLGTAPVVWGTWPGVAPRKSPYFNISAFPAPLMIMTQ